MKDKKSEVYVEKLWKIIGREEKFPLYGYLCEL